MLARWEPFGSLRRRGDIFSDLSTMQQEMNRFFEEFFGERHAELIEGNWLPAVDVSENDSAIIVRAELPGMTQEDIELNLQDNVLTLQGEKKKMTEEEKENCHRLERCYGSFNRSFTLPVSVDQDNISATFKDGILVVNLPKSEEARPKKIAIATGA